MEVSTAVNRRELQRYLTRVGDRWPIDVAMLGGARVADEHGAPPQRERGPEFVVILVSAAYEGMPWLERVYQAGSLWDGLEMGAPADVHCYTPAEFERKRVSLPRVREAVDNGIDLMAVPAGLALADRHHPLDRQPRPVGDLGREPSPRARRRAAHLRSFGSVIIFMNRQCAASLAAMNSVSGAASRSGYSIPVSVATIAVIGSRPPVP